MYKKKGKKTIQKYQRQILVWFTISIGIIGLGMGSIGFFLNTNYDTFSGLVILISIVSLFFLYKDKYEFASNILLIGSTFLLLLQVYLTNSAYIGMMLAFVMIIAGIIKSILFLSILLLINLISIIIFTAMGILTWDQIIDPVQNIAYVNNVTVLIPALIIAYFISIVISRTLIRLIQRQEREYEILEEAQNTIIRKQKLESIKLLTNGIAHDFNNLLSAIMGNISLLQLEDYLPENAVEFLNEAEKASIQARNLTNRLLQFSKNQNIINRMIVDLPNIITDTLQMILRNRNLRVEYDIEGPINKIFGDRIQLAQVFQNLAINADEAIKSDDPMKQGLIKVSIRNVKIQKINTKLIKEGNYVEIEFLDNGPGIAPEIQQKIFDPYFTTKKTGSGIGLPLSYSIIENHQGHIEIESELRKGAKFIILLPAIENEIPIQNLDLPKMTEGHRLAYIMDDQPQILLVLGAILNKLNFKVEKISEGTKLIEKLKNQQKNEIVPDLFILDLVIPNGMGGRVTAIEIKKLLPQAKIILSSGFSKKLNREKENKIFDEILNKPYSFKEVRKIIQRINFDDNQTDIQNDIHKNN